MRDNTAERKKPPARVRIAPDAKILVGREEAAQLLSISVRGIDYLLANRRLPFRKLGGESSFRWRNCGSMHAAITPIALWGDTKLRHPN